MYQWPHTYTDYNGNERTETFYFNLTKADIQDLEFRTPGGIRNYVTSIVNTLDGQKIADFFKDLIQKSYGIKSPDGRRFMKSDEILKAFTETEAYSDLYMSIATNDKAAAEFFNGIFPKEMVDAAEKQKELAEKAGLDPTQLGPHPFIQQTVAPAAPVIPTVEGQVVTPAPQPAVPMVEGQQVITPVQPIQ